MESLHYNRHWDRTNPALKHFTPTRLVRWCLDLLRPAILTRGRPRKALMPTSYLDGLRGFAAFLVYWSHHQGWPRGATDANAIFESGFGYEGQYYFACLPGIRNFFSGGHYAVAVFFVISGHVLSTKPLAMIHAGNHDKLGQNLASALFRRWLRLYLPVICTTFLYMTSWHALGLYTAYPDHLSTYLDELTNWYKEFKQFSFVFKIPEKGEYIPWFTYNFHLWSIPYEFRGSVIVYTVLSALSRCRKNARLWCEIGLIFYFLYIADDATLLAMFVAGVSLCDLDLLARHKDLPGFFWALEPYKRGIFYTFFAMSVYLSAVPIHNYDFNALRATPGWYYLSFLKPENNWDPKWFYVFWAALFLGMPRFLYLIALEAPLLDSGACLATLTPSLSI
jgi:peptidoglycan/LPS O-acetylase OafA/YrhL